jgi:hypothetical protein
MDDTGTMAEATHPPGIVVKIVGIETWLQKRRKKKKKKRKKKRNYDQTHVKAFEVK